mmetsp:Transcript_2047/g.4778  ORF Transcript_2047/g.4778 Transcript_2047/m.4778 type:complete len:340 (+) Transcript_2047:329-1348(+)
MAGMILDSRDDQGGALRSAAEDTPLMPEWTAELEEQRVWKIVKRKMLTPWRTKPYCRMMACTYFALISYLIIVSYCMSEHLTPHPVPERNWGCHYIHQLPSAFLRTFLVPFPLAAMLAANGLFRFPLTTLLNAVICFCHVFCGLCICFIFVVDELPGFQPPLDSYGFKSYTPYHFVPATIGYCFMEAGRDFACLATIADAVVVTMTYRHWRKVTAEREAGDDAALGHLLNDAQKQGVSGKGISEFTQRQIALYQKRKWTIQAFHRLVLVMQALAFMASIVLMRVLYLVYLAGGHHWLFVMLGCMQRHDAHYQFAADFLRNMIISMTFYFTVVIMPLAAL